MPYEVVYFGSSRTASMLDHQITDFPLARQEPLPKSLPFNRPFGPAKYCHRWATEQPKSVDVQPFALEFVLCSNRSNASRECAEPQLGCLNEPIVYLCGGRDTIDRRRFEPAMILHQDRRIDCENKWFIETKDLGACSGDLAIQARYTGHLHHYLS